MYATDYQFEFHDVEAKGFAELQERFSQGRGAVVDGAPGSGKSWSVAQIVNGAVWATVPDSPMAVARVLADIAEQVSEPAVVGAYAEQGAAAACSVLDKALHGRTLVLDGLDRLARFKALDAFADSDTRALWFDEADALKRWGLQRADETLTFVIGRHFPDRDSLSIGEPTKWAVKLRHSAKGLVPWENVAHRLRRRPGGLFLAAATLRLGGPGRLKAWLDETADATVREAERALGHAFTEIAPNELQRLLALLSAAGEVEAKVLDELADGDESLPFALDLADELRLLERRDSRVRLAGHLKACRAVKSLRAAGGESLTRQLTACLLGRVNDRTSLQPLSARRVLDAHRLQLATGDIAGALTTARLHVGGLVTCARDHSMSAESPEDFDVARRLYGQIRGMLSEHAGLARPHVRSYVDHYHGYNGYRARTLGLGQVAADYDRAIEGWRENALWHARRVALAAERGDLALALSMQASAYMEVPDHPRRDPYLKVRAAAWASSAGAHVAAMRLLDDYQAPPNLSTIDAVAAQELYRLAHRWARGVRLERLTDDAGVEVVLTSPVDVRVEADGGEWLAQVHLLRPRGQGDTPWRAMTQLARALADECRTLIQTPTGRLERRDAAYKGVYLGLVDLVNSQVGLSFATHRWLLGTVSGAEFVPRQAELESIALPEALRPDTHQGYFLARVPIDRGGYPDGPVDRLVPAGAGDSLQDMLFILKRLAEEDDDAA